MSSGISAINAAVQEASAFVPGLLGEINRVVVGQKYLVERLVIGLLANGHVLLEGVPGLAKTLSVKTLANTLSVRFSRLQFTPDMLPDLQPTVRCFHHPARTGLCQYRPRGRNQPGSRQGAKRFAGSHAGKTGDHW
jgi:hypothetical protein